MWFELLSEPFNMGLWSISIGALGTAVAGIILANTDYFLSKIETATLDYIGDTGLQTLSQECVRGHKAIYDPSDPLYLKSKYKMTLWRSIAEEMGKDESRTFKAKELWEKNGAVIMAVRRPGCFLCREEAAGLSSLRPELDQLGIPLYAVVKENIGNEIGHFQPYFKGEIFLDEKKRFYGPQKRKMLFLGFIRLGVWQNFRRAWKAGFEGNLEGEGLILGGVFVIGSGNQGILLEHREKEFGDKANLTAILEAAKMIKLSGDH